MISIPITSQRPFAVQVASRLSHLYQSLGGRIDLSADALLEAAMKRTGLSDWGNEDFVEGLRVLIHSYETDANLNLIGRYLVRMELTRVLSNRLLIQQEITRHPEILQETIDQPLFITGMPRTGSTLLHRLLAQDPQSRVLRPWEAINPLPPPDKATEHNDPRIAKLERQARIIRLLLPKLASIHKSNATLPEQCDLLLRHHLPSPNGHEVLGFASSYRDWADQQDMLPAYRHFRQQLQLLQWRSPGSPWILKAPRHLIALDALLTVFPDACLVQTHRDPITVVASFISLKSVTLSITSDNLDLKQVGQFFVNRFVREIERGLQVRATLQPGQIYDLFYDDFVTDPIKMARQIYTYFGYKITPQMDQNMKAWLPQNQQYKHGVHHYSLKQFGLDETLIREKFAKYYEAFPRLRLFHELNNPKICGGKAIIAGQSTVGKA